MSSSSSSSSGLTWLEDQIVSFPEAASHYQQLSADYQKKLWHQISVKLHELTTLPFLAAPSVNQLLRLHDHFIIKFQNKLNPLDYATFVSVAAEQATDPLAFLTPLLPSVASDPQASLFLKNEITRRIMAQGKMDRWDECKDRIEEAKKTLDGYIGIMEPIVHSSYYRAALLYHKARGPASAYYSNSLLYLTYTPLESIPPAEQIQLASEVGLAALIGDNIYNFGELLQHPIVKTLTGTQHDWIAQMLEAFNSGNIAKFKTILAAKQATEPILPANRDFLNQKIRIMSLIELVFRRPSNERKLTFAEIATHCELKPDEVELLLMKSFSLKVLKGTIDQVDSYVRINWVQPRVLNMEQIASVRDRLQTWSKEVNETAQFLEENAKTIL